VNVTVPPSVVGRAVFYNSSAFDGGDAAANLADDGAIATDKAALLPGQTATYANYTNYSRSINGLMIDINGLPNVGAGLTAADFAFLAGTDPDPANWTQVPVPSGVTVRAGALAGGGDRIEVVFADGAVMNEWLRVTVLANANTGLAAADVFYFGNLVGETGNQSGFANVSASDVNLVKAALAAGTSSVPIDSALDFNRNGLLSTSDVNLAKLYAGAALPLLNAPAIGAAVAAAAVPAASVSAAVISGTAPDAPADPGSTSAIATAVAPPPPPPLLVVTARGNAAAAFVPTPLVLIEDPVAVPRFDLRDAASSVLLRSDADAKDG